MGSNRSSAQNVVTTISFFPHVREDLRPLIVKATAAA